MDIISPNKVLQIRYNIPYAHLITVDIDCSKNTNVWIVTDKGLDEFFSDTIKEVSCYKRSEKTMQHNFSFSPKGDGRWYMLICNTNEEDVYVSYRVVSK